MGDGGADRGLQAREKSRIGVGEVAAEDDAAERDGRAGLAFPAVAEVGGALQSVALVGEPAFVDDDAPFDFAVQKLFVDAVEPLVGDGRGNR